MADDPTEDMIKKEMAEAVRILREDGVHIHRTYARFQKALEGDKTDPPANPPGPGDPPPPKDPPVDPPKKKGIWWGERE